MNDCQIGMRYCFILFLLLCPLMSLQAQSLEEKHFFQIREEQWPLKFDSLFEIKLGERLFTYEMQERIRAERIRDSLQSVYPCYIIRLRINCDRPLGEELAERYEIKQYWRFSHYSACLAFTIKWEFLQKSSIPISHSGQIICNWLDLPLKK